MWKWHVKVALTIFSLFVQVSSEKEVAGIGSLQGGLVKTLPQGLDQARFDIVSSDGVHLRCPVG